MGVVIWGSPRPPPPPLPPPPSPRPPPPPPWCTPPSRTGSPTALLYQLHHENLFKKQYVKFSILNTVQVYKRLTDSVTFNRYHGYRSTSFDTLYLKTVFLNSGEKPTTFVLFSKKSCWLF